MAYMRTPRSPNAWVVDLDDDGVALVRFPAGTHIDRRGGAAPRHVNLGNPDANNDDAAFAGAMRVVDAHVVRVRPAPAWILITIRVALVAMVAAVTVAFATRFVVMRRVVGLGVLPVVRVPDDVPPPGPDDGAPPPRIESSTSGAGAGSTTRAPQLTVDLGSPITALQDQFTHILSCDAFLYTIGAMNLTGKLLSPPSQSKDGGAAAYPVSTSHLWTAYELSTQWRWAAQELKQRVDALLTGWYRSQHDVPAECQIYDKFLVGRKWACLAGLYARRHEPVPPDVAAAARLVAELDALEASALAALSDTLRLADSLVLVGGGLAHTGRWAGWLLRRLDEEIVGGGGVGKGGGMPLLEGPEGWRGARRDGDGGKGEWTTAKSKEKEKATMGGEGGAGGGHPLGDSSAKTDVLTLARAAQQLLAVYPAEKDMGDIGAKLAKAMASTRGMRERSDRTARSVREYLAGFVAGRRQGLWQLGERLRKMRLFGGEDDRHHSEAATLARIERLLARLARYDAYGALLETHLAELGALTGRAMLEFVVALEGLREAAAADESGAVVVPVWGEAKNALAQARTVEKAAWRLVRTQERAWEEMHAMHPEGRYVEDVY